MLVLGVTVDMTLMEELDVEDPTCEDSDKVWLAVPRVVEESDADIPVLDFANVVFEPTADMRVFVLTDDATEDIVVTDGAALDCSVLVITERVDDGPHSLLGSHVYSVQVVLGMSVIQGRILIVVGMQVTSSFFSLLYSAVTLPSSTWKHSLILLDSVA